MWWHKRRNQISSFGWNGRVHLNWAGGVGGGQFSRLLAAEVCASAVVMLDTPCCEVVRKVLATQSIRQFPLHFPSRALPCAITFQLDSTILYEVTSNSGTISLTRSWSPRRHIWCQLSHTGSNLLLVPMISSSHWQWEKLHPETRNYWQIRRWGFRCWKRRVTVWRSLNSGTWLRVVWCIGVALGGVTEERYIDEYFFEGVSHCIWRKHIKLLQFTAEGPHSIGDLINAESRTQQDRQCTFTVTLRRVRTTTDLVEKQWVLHIVWAG